MYTAISPDANATTWIPILREKVTPDSLVYTDSFGGTMCWLSRSFITSVSITVGPVCRRGATTSMGLSTFGIKRSGPCVASTASLNTVFTGSCKNASGGSDGAGHNALFNQLKAWYQSEINKA